MPISHPGGVSRTSASSEIVESDLSIDLLALESSNPPIWRKAIIHIAREGPRPATNSSPIS